MERHELEPDTEIGQMVVAEAARSGVNHVLTENDGRMGNRQQKEETNQAAGRKSSREIKCRQLTINRYLLTQKCTHSSARPTGVSLYSRANESQLSSLSIQHL